MARPPMTLEVAQHRITKKFPDRNLELLEFTGAEFPCVLRCPLHGDIRVSSYANVLRSAAGCPTCGRVAARKQATLTTRQRSTDADILQIIRALGQTTQDDVQFAQAVRQLLSTSDT